jgi:hypothetical protein
MCYTESAFKMNAGIAGKLQQNPESGQRLRLLSPPQTFCN